MFHQRSNTSFVYSSPALWFWFLMATSGGAINAGGFLSCQRFVTHITGFATLFGVDVANGDYWLAISMLTVPLYFMLGCIISTWLVDKQKFNAGIPRYDLVLTLMVALLSLIVYGGQVDWFGTFGEEINVKKDYSLLAMLCMCAGLQNSMVSLLSGAIVRTTHMTGVLSDLGIGLVRITYKKLPAEDKSKEFKANKLRLGLLLSFVLGSLIGSFLFVRYQYWGFLFPLSVTCYAWLLSIRERTAKGIP